MKEKTTLTITVCKKTCEKLKRLIPEGKISGFISRLVEENVKKMEQGVVAEYQKINQDQELNSQLKKWDILNQKLDEREKNKGLI